LCAFAGGSEKEAVAAIDAVTRRCGRGRWDVLESMGWSIERIWSTDWFMDPKKEIRPVLEAIEQLVAEDTEQ
jgi:hypothetical protein